MNQNYERAKEFYKTKKGKLFGSYGEGKEFFDEIIEKYNSKKGYYIGEGVDLNSLVNSHFLDDRKSDSVSDVYIPIKDTFGHTAIIGTTRRGKTRLQMALVRQMIINGENVFLTEPKGSVGQEVISWVLEFLEEVGQLEAFKYISPAFPSYSLPFNSFFGMDDESIASSVANTIQAKETFYADIGYDITMAICLALRFLEEVKDKKEVERAIQEEYKRIFSSSFIQDPLKEILSTSTKSIGAQDLTMTITKGSGDKEREVRKPPFRSLMTVSDVAYYASPSGLEELKELVEGVSEEHIELMIRIDKNKEFDSNQAKEEKIRKLKELKREVLKNLQSQLDKPKDYFNKVATSYKLILDKLSTGKLGELLCSVKINPLLDLLKNGKNQTVVVMQPAPLMFKEASVGLMRLVSSMLMNWYGRVGMSGRSFSRTLNFVVDEGGAVLTKEMVDLLNKGGALKLKITIGTQSFGDYITALGQDWANVALDNMNVKIYFAVNDDLSRQKVSDLFGSAKQASSSFGNSGIDMRGQVNYQAEELVLSSHISELPRQTFLYQNAGDKYLVKSPYLHDANNFVKMPYLDMENEIDKYYENTLKDVLSWEKDLD